MQAPLIVSVVEGFGGRRLGYCMLQVESDFLHCCKLTWLHRVLHWRFRLISVNVCIDLQCFVATYILNVAEY